VESQVLDFLVDRARHIFMERHGYAHDEVNAALAAIRTIWSMLPTALPQ